MARPGPVLGLTATPWRLSQREGFNHLFRELHCGPQVEELQSDHWLCKARVLLSPEGERVEGGEIDYTGDYSESGIELANEHRDVWTAGALRFWQKHGEDRQTVVYAVSVRHALNLFAVFNDAGVPAGLLLGDTPTAERAKLIAQFKDGDIRALVNVAVATEGFDLPDAGCVILTRPTKSLSLYLQMVGRGLRPKQDDSDCVILDLAGNGLRHGIPEEEREWSLQPRKTPPPGMPPVVWCQSCEHLSPAASHRCRNCGAPFGEVCDRCGAWRVWERWTRKTVCGQEHDPVCDLCHYDAHIQARLPVTAELEELAMLRSDYELPPHRDPFLKNLLEEERRRISGSAEERMDELRSFIRVRESELANDYQIDKLFENHLATLAMTERPQTRREERRLFDEWEGGLKQELEGRKKELAALESQPMDGQLIFNNARERLLQMLEAEAIEAGLIPQNQIREIPSQGSDREYSNRRPLDIDAWMTFAELRDMTQNNRIDGFAIKPVLVRNPTGVEKPIGRWADLLLEAAEWLIRERLLTKSTCPVTFNRWRRYLVHVAPINPENRPFHYANRLSNGLHLECGFGVKDMVRNSNRLLEKFDQDPSWFQVRLSQ